MVFFLVEGQTILPSFDQRLRKFAEKRFHQRKNYHLVKDFVVEVGKDFVALKSGDIIKTGLIVWSTGLSPRSFISMFPSKTTFIFRNICEIFPLKLPRYAV